MEFLDYVRLVLRSWVTVLGLGLVGLLIGMGSVEVATPTYRATAEMFVGTDLQEGVNLQASQFTLDRMQSYAALVNSTQVTQGVRTRLDLDMSAEQVGDTITASVIPDSVLIRLDVEDTRPRRTAEIANAAAQRLGDTIQAIEAPPGGESPLSVTVTKPATTPQAPISPRRTIRLGLGLVLGLGAGLVAVGLREQLRRSSPPAPPRTTRTSRLRTPAVSAVAGE